MSDVELFEALSLFIHPSMSEEEWIDAGETVRAADRDIPWIAGDWVLHGEQFYGDGRDMAVKILSHLAPSTVSRYGFVAKRFPPDRRFNISFWHHSEVAMLPAERADAILEKAVEKRLSQKDVRNLAQQERAILRGRMDQLDTNHLEIERKQTRDRYYSQYWEKYEQVKAHPEIQTVTIDRELFLALEAKVPKPKQVSES